MTSSGAGRHLTAASLAEHWRSGVPMLVPIVGEPEIQLLVDAQRGMLALRISAPGPVALPRDTLAHLRSTLLVQHGQHFIDVSVLDSHLSHDGYALLAAIADRVQLDGYEPVRAIRTTTDAWRRLLASRTGLSVEAEVGLFGEMLVLRALCRDDRDAATCWRGGDAEEHDFDFGDFDAEVKTTSGEGRRHWVHGLDQLQETPGRPLWLLSLQVTRGDGRDARSLTELVDEVLSAAGDQHSAALMTKLARAGWRQEQADLLRDRWRLRSQILAFRIDSSFPRLTSAVLRQAHVQLGSIDSVTYQIDVSGLPCSSQAPMSLSAAIGSMEKNDG